jgi:hypothetical protein
MISLTRWLALGVCLAAGRVEAAEDLPQSSVNGLYPLWEQTAVLHPAGGGQIGHGHAQLGLGPVQVGTQPFLDLYQTFNLQLKLALPGNQRHRTALVMGAYRVPAQAEARALGDLHRPGFTNQYGPVGLFPVSLAHSFAASERLQLHSTLTGLLRHGDDPMDRQPSLGLATMVAWHASWHWSARLHGGVWGLGVEPQAHAGLSFAYEGERMTVAAGYARQASFTGESRAVFLLDFALLFR